MTLEQLRIFVAVASREHMTAAARDLNLTQSAISSAIAALENRYQTKLFDRIGRGIALTAAGRIFLDEARAVLARAAAAEAVLVELAGLKRGALAIGASQTVGNYWLPRIIATFSAAYPGVSVAMTLDNTEAVARLTREGAVDLGFVEGETHEPSLVVEQVAEDELLLLMAPDHRWATRPPRTKKDFADARWVFREKGSGTREAAERALESLGLSPGDYDIALEFPSNEAVRGAVEAGAGVSVLSRHVALRPLKAGLLKAAETPLARRGFFSLRRKDRFVTAAMRAFLVCVAEQNDA